MECLPTLVSETIRTISIMNVQGSDILLLPVLEATLNHLLELFDSSDHPFEVIHDFISNKTRSIRQDISMQHIVNDQAISLYEKMVKFMWSTTIGFEDVTLMIQLLLPYVISMLNSMSSLLLLGTIYMMPTVNQILYMIMKQNFVHCMFYFISALTFCGEFSWLQFLLCI